MCSRRAVILALAVLTVMSAMADVSRRLFKNYTSADGLADNSAQTIHCTKTGRLVITTAGQINFYDGSKFSSIDAIDENVYPLPEYRGNYHLYFDKFHHIWLKNRYTVSCVDLLTERFVASIEDEFKAFGVTEKVNDLFVDSLGTVWLLMDKGLYNVKTKQTIKPQANLNLQDLEVWKDRYVMLFYENGLMEMYDQKTGKKRLESHAYGEADVATYGSTSVLRMDGDKLYQLRNGQKEAILLCYDLKQNQWSDILRTPYHLNNIGQKDSLIFIPCEYGYWALNTNTGETRHYSELRMENGMELSTDINVIAFDRQGGMWAGTESRGLLYSRPYASPFNVYAWGDSRADHYGAMMDNVDQNPQYRKRTVNCVYKDSRGWTWVGTRQGLQLYRKETDMLPQVYTKKDGLHNNIVHSVVEDLEHNIWVATSYGISVVLFKDDRVHYIRSYNEYDRLPNEVFVNGKAMRMDDGTIVMQALDHVVEFNPSRFSTIKADFEFQIYPKLAQLMVNGIDVNTTTEIDGKRIIDRAISRIWGVDLNYDQNTITMVFTALNYFRPSQTYYRVRIVGLDDEWRVLTPYGSHNMIDSHGMLHLPLIALRPGHYEVEVQTSMSPDKWDSKPYVWTININEPWWRTTGIFLLFSLLLAVLFLINVFYYVKNANLKALRASEETMLVKRIYAFVERCNGNEEVLEPTSEEYSTANASALYELDPAFVKVLGKIQMTVMTHKKKKMTMHRLSNAAGVSQKDFYKLITNNIFKSPRSLIKQNRLVEAEKMLRGSKATIAEIADHCGFISANYFIASFFQKHKLTPEMYRRKH